MTIVTSGNDQIVEQIIKQLHKLINVIKVNDLTGTDHVEREMMLVKVATDANNRAEVLRIADIFRAKVVDVSPKYFTIETTGDEGKLNALTELLKPHGIKEVARTGKIAMIRSTQSAR
jgi:acetolactate synthase-1/3 small subunit